MDVVDYSCTRTQASDLYVYVYVYLPLFSPARERETHME